MSEISVGVKPDWKDINPKFIISTGRTGTKFLAQFFNSLSTDIDARHEPKPLCRKLGYEFSVGQISLEEAIKQFIKKRNALYSAIKHSPSCIYIESNPYLALLIPIIQSVFSNYKIVHIVRDGRDWVRSAISRPGYITPASFLPILRSLPSQVENHIDVIPSFLNRFLVDAWNIRAIDFPDDPYYKKWPRMSRFEKIAWIWAKKEESIYQAIRDDDNAITLKFEDIFDGTSNYSGLRKLLAWFNLEEITSDARERIDQYMGIKVNKTASYKLCHWKEWSQSQRETFKKIAGHWLEFYGYETKESKRNNGRMT